MIHKLRLFLYAIVVAVLCTVPFQPLMVSADDQLPQDIIDSVKQDSVWTDTTTLLSCTVPSPQSASGNVFVLGDSYAEGLEQHKLGDALIKAGFDSVKFDGSRGRSIAGAGTTGNKLSAMDAVKADQSDIKAAGTILIVLGTNPANYGTQIPDFMKSLNITNGTAKKFWINTGNLDTTDKTQTTINKAIAANAKDYSYTVIDWYALFKKSPSTYFSTAGGQAGLHPNDAGYAAMTTLIIDALSQSTPAATSDIGYGSASQNNKIPKSISEITVVKSPGTNANKKAIFEANGRIVYSYLVGKGLSPIQAAGILGNLVQEAHYQADDSTERSWPKGGYGIVQWTAGRRLNIAKAMDTAGIGNLYHPGRVADSEASILLGFELDYMWWELYNHDNYGLPSLKKASNIEDATKIIFDKYEAPGDDTLPVRIKYAKEELAKFSGTAGLESGGVPDGCSTDTPAGAAGQYGWDLVGANAMVYYSQYDKKFASAKFGRTIKECGCGPTSMAMIISTLNHDSSVNPINVAAYYESKGGVADGCGSNWKWTVLSDKYNLKYTEDYHWAGKDVTVVDFDKVNNTLAQGGLVLISVGVGEFTSTGHLMVIRKTTPDGKSYYLADPIGPDIKSVPNTKAYSIQELRDPQKGHIRAAWGFTK